MKVAIVFALVVLAAPRARAQPFNIGALDRDASVATITAGHEHGLLVGMGYARKALVADRFVVIGGELALQWAEVDTGDFRLRVGALAPLLGAGCWRLVGGLAASVHGADTDSARMVGIGADAVLLAGRYGRHWLAAAEAGFDWTLATHIAHSDAYRMQVYADARDGWYGNAGGMVPAGVQAGVSFGGNDVVVRAGRLLDITGASPLFPFYATLGYARRW